MLSEKGGSILKQKTMGETIAARRKERGMTQLELAREMGVTDKAVSKWERNLSCPDVGSIPHLAEVLQISVEELVQSGPAPARHRGGGQEKVVLICRCVALAMGVAVAVLSALNGLDAGSGLSMLGIGLAALALSALPSGE